MSDAASSCVVLGRISWRSQRKSTDPRPGTSIALGTSACSRTTRPIAASPLCRFSRCLGDSAALPAENIIGVSSPRVALFFALSTLSNARATVTHSALPLLNPRLTMRSRTQVVNRRHTPGSSSSRSATSGRPSTTFSNSRANTSCRTVALSSVISYPASRCWRICSRPSVNNCVSPTALQCFCSF